MTRVERCSNLVQPHSAPEPQPRLALLSSSTPLWATAERNNSGFRGYFWVRQRRHCRLQGWVTGHGKDRQPLTLAPMDNLESPCDLTCMSLVWGRKLKYLEKILHRKPRFKPEPWSTNTLVFHLSINKTAFYSCQAITYRLADVGDSLRFFPPSSTTGFTLYF